MLVFFGLMVLVESLNTTRFAVMHGRGGLPLALLGMVVPASSLDSNGTLLRITRPGSAASRPSSTCSSGTSLTIMKAAGLSIWRILIWPLVALTTVSQ